MHGARRPRRVPNRLRPCRVRAATRDAPRCAGRQPLPGSGCSPTSHAITPSCMGRSGLRESSDIDDSWRAPQFADALAAFIAALELERPHVVGHSFGTMVAFSLFQRHPAVPASLVLVGGYAGWAGSLPARRGGTTARDVPRHGRAGRGVRPEVVPGPVHRTSYPRTATPALVTMMRENVRPASIRAAGRTGAETDLRPVFRPSTCRRFVLHGEADARSPLANADALHAAISTSRLVVLPEARPCMCGGGPRGLRGGDPPVRRRRRLRSSVDQRRLLARGTG